MVVVEHLRVELLEDVRLAPFDEAPVAGAAATELRRNRVPLASRPQPVDDAGKGLPVVDRRSPSARTAPSLRQPLLHQRPEVVGDVCVFGLHVQQKSCPCLSRKFSTRFDGRLLVVLWSFESQAPYFGAVFG